MENDFSLVGAGASVREVLAVMMSDVFDLLIDALYVPLKYPTNDRHRHQGGEYRDQVRVFPGNTDAHVDFFCRKQRLRLMSSDSKFERLTKVGTGWGTNRGTNTNDVWSSGV